MATKSAELATCNSWADSESDLEDSVGSPADSVPCRASPSENKKHNGHTLEKTESGQEQELRGTNGFWRKPWANSSQPWKVSKADNSDNWRGLKKKETEFLGTVISIKIRSGQGFIKPDESLPDGYLDGDVMFYTRLKGSDVDVGDRVRFVLTDQTKDRPQAYKVQACPGQKRVIINERGRKYVKSSKAAICIKKYVQCSGLTNPKVQGKITSSSNLFSGLVAIAELPEQFNGYNDVVSFYSSQVQPECIGLSYGDTLEFQIESDMINPKTLTAHDFRLVKCAPKSKQQIDDCLQAILSKLNIAQNSNQKGPVLQILRCEAIWQCIGNSPTLNRATIIQLFNVLEILKEQSKSSAQIYQQAMESLMNTDLGKYRKSPLKNFISEAWADNDKYRQEKVKKFVLMILDCLPAKAKVLIKFLGSVLPLHAADSTAHFLYSVMQGVCVPDENSIDSLEWDEVPLVPASDELVKGSSLTHEYLKPVKTHGAYDSVQEYVDTYFRLLRDDCFSSLRNGVQSYLNNCLDPMDMAIYMDVSLERISLSNRGSGVMLGLKIMPLKPIDDWLACSNLIYGNLLCLSPTGSFTDEIWATVAERDEDLLVSESLIWVELVTTSNRCDDSECITMLKDAGSRTIMAESPTFYMAYWPVLRALQVTDPDSMAFQEELVHARPPLPSQIPCTPYTPLLATMDASQQRAFMQSLQWRIGIIQGPPGTGKTFVGTKLIQHFVQQKRGPIVILTYKNHALDEFTKAVREILPNEVVRIGGGYKDESLLKITLKYLKFKGSKLRENASERQAVQTEVSTIRSTLKTLLGKLNSSVVFSAETVLQTFGVSQVEALLSGCPVYSQKRVERTRIHELLNDFKATKAANKNQTESVSTLADPELLDLIQQAVKQWLPIRMLEEVHKFEEGLGDFSALKSVTRLTALDQASTLRCKSETDKVDVSKEIADRLAPLTSNAPIREEGDDIKLSNPQTLRVPFLPSIAKRWAHALSVQQLRRIDDPWKVSSWDRVLVVQIVLWHERQKVERELKSAMQRYRELLEMLKELDIQHEVAVLESKKVLAMTITGASIHQRLLHLLKPEIIIVEEAAEVLEPQLMAVIGGWVKHLVLIGDHKQLRPSVESHVLARDYHLDVSLMERLINNNHPYATLKLQNRMLPEMAELLRDIYPDLCTNRAQIDQNLRPQFLPAMFFWTHQHEETVERSFSNTHEAEMVVKLALLFLAQGYNPEKVTILAAYRGQVKLLREVLMDELGEENPILETLGVHTIDMFQGDENDIVIISLVRSNQEGNIGFLKTINRRCVAQSRARCGMYFIGNAATFQMARGSCWTSVIKKLEKEGLVGEGIPVFCPSHPENSRILAKTADELPNSKGLCDLPCPNMMSCGIHPCKKNCQPPHQGSELHCYETVEFVHKGCGHADTRECWQAESTCTKPCDKTMLCGAHPCQRNCRPRHSHITALCTVRVAYTFPECGHQTQKPCGDQEADLVCLKSCKKTMTCRLHACKKKCHPPHSHDKVNCRVKVVHMFPRCGHMQEKECGEDGTNLVCDKCECQNAEKVHTRQDNKERRARLATYGNYSMGYSYLPAGERHGVE